MTLLHYGLRLSENFHNVKSSKSKSHCMVDSGAASQATHNHRPISFCMLHVSPLTPCPLCATLAQWRPFSSFPYLRRLSSFMEILSLFCLTASFCLAWPSRQLISCTAYLGPLLFFQ